MSFSVHPLVRWIMLAAFLAGCSGGVPVRLELSAWRSVPLPVPIHAAAPDEGDRDVLFAAGEGKLLRVRLSDGAVLDSIALDVVWWGGLAASKGRIFAQTPDRLVILKGMTVKEESALPKGTDEGLAVDRVTGAVYVAAGPVLYRRDPGAATWQEVARAEKPWVWISPRTTAGIVFGRSALYREGEGIRSFDRPDLFGGFFHFQAWVSPSDPGFILAAGHPGPAVSRDGGKRWEAVATEFDYFTRQATGYERRGRRLLFLESNSGKSSLGVTWASTLWISRDGGRTFSKIPAPPPTAIEIGIGGHTLYLVGEGGRLWVSEITERPEMGP